VIEEKVRDEYPDLAQMPKLEPANIEHSAEKGYDLDFPVCNSSKYIFLFQHFNVFSLLLFSFVTDRAA
jgi:hypothetical protein